MVNKKLGYRRERAHLTSLYRTVQRAFRYVKTRVQQLWSMSTSFGWEGKGRYGSFRLRMNAGCAGKTLRSLDNTCHTWAP